MDIAEILFELVGKVIENAEENGCDTGDKALAEIEHQLEYVKQNYNVARKTSSTSSMMDRIDSLGS